jgi:3-dehydrosphinganine reductase
MLSKLGTIPDIVICTAGGTPTQGGFLADIAPKAIKSCLELNYYTSVFIVQSCLRLWLATPKTPETRHIVLTSSTAAFVGLPGYIAYTTTKVAIRALADTLRQELLMYGEDAFKVHCTFPGNFLSDSLISEQARKPKLLKMMDGTDCPEDELRKKVTSSRAVAKKIIRGLEVGKMYITVDFGGQILFNNMRGPSPRYHSFLDFCIGLIAVVAWWWVRLDFDRKTRKYGREHYAQNPRSGSGDGQRD